MWKVWCKVRFAHCVNWNGENTPLCSGGTEHPTQCGMLGCPAWFCSDTPNILRTGSSFQIGWLWLLLVCETEWQHRLRLLLTVKIMIFFTSELCTSWVTERKWLAERSRRQLVYSIYNTMSGETHTWDFCSPVLLKLIPVSILSSFDFVPCTNCTLVQTC